MKRKDFLRSFAGGLAGAAMLPGLRQANAMTGMASPLPAIDPADEQFWKLLREGRDAVVEIPPQRWDLAEYFDPDPDAPGKLYTRWGGLLDRALVPSSEPMPRVTTAYCTGWRRR